MRRVGFLSSFFKSWIEPICTLIKRANAICKISLDIGRNAIKIAAQGIFGLILILKNKKSFLVYPKNSAFLLKNYWAALRDAQLNFGKNKKISIWPGKQSLAKTFDEDCLSINDAAKEGIKNIRLMLDQDDAASQV